MAGLRFRTGTSKVNGDDSSPWPHSKDQFLKQLLKDLHYQDGQGESDRDLHESSVLTAGQQPRP